MSLQTSTIHPTAEVSKDAIIGENVFIWHHAQVREGAIIGNNTILAKNVYIDRNVKIGENCKIQNNSSIYNKAVLEKGVFIGPHCIFTNDRYPRAENPDGTIKKSDALNSGKIFIKEGASLGARTTVLPEITIGKYALIGANSLITKDLPDFALACGSPAKIIGYVCRCGRKIAEDQSPGELCKECKITFRT